jgi:zinc-ribbon domain
MSGDIICSKCGRENGPEQTFCASCGAFLEWTGEKAAGDPAAEARPGGPAGASPAASPVTTPELAGLARGRPPREGAAPAAGPAPAPAGRSSAPAQPPLATPVRPGPSQRSVPPAPAEPDPAVRAAGPAVAPDPTIACPACGRPNPVNRNFCHSCGTLLRPKPRQPMARRRRSGSAYRLLSIILLIAIILIGSFLLTRLTTTRGGSSPSPSPTRASITRLVSG